MSRGGAVLALALAAAATLGGIGLPAIDGPVEPHPVARRRAQRARQLEHARGAAHGRCKGR